MLCRCGCGEDTGVYLTSRPRVGVTKGSPRPFVTGHWRRLNCNRGAAHESWKGGRSKNVNGYIVLPRPDGRHIYEHRAVMAEILGRELESNEIVHHIDGDKTNNAVENLQLMDRAEHTRLHARERTYT